MCWKTHIKFKILLAFVKKIGEKRKGQRLVGRRTVEDGRIEECEEEKKRKNREEI
jgi:hypothetical protein